MRNSVGSVSYQPDSIARQTDSKKSGAAFLSGMFTGFFFSSLIVGIAIACMFSFGVVTVNGASIVRIDDTNETKPEGRSIRDLRLDTKAFIKNSKRKDDLDLQVSAVLDLCSLHREIVHDSRFDTHSQLKSLRAQIASRLKTYNKDLKLTIMRRKRDNVDLDPSTNTASDNNSNLSDNSLLGGSSEDGRDDGELSNSMGESMSTMFASVGGPASIFGHLQGNFAPPWDYGDDLVKLIETTIAPDSWKNAGGEAVIHYYQPLRIIVVSATSRVHDEMTDMLRQMRRLNR